MPGNPPAMNQQESFLLVCVVVSSGFIFASYLLESRTIGDAPAMDIDADLAASLARRFRLVRLLGAGGMGAVYLAEQVAVGNRPVALKVLSRKLLDDPNFLLRFQNEAASTGRIHHVNVVTIYESGQADDGTPYIAMEFLEGESLREALARRGASKNGGNDNKEPGSEGSAAELLALVERSCS
jgi:serine/threonine protein kinase